MPLDTTTPLSYGWWLRRLTRKLADNRSEIGRLHELYTGEQGVPGSSEDDIDEFREFQKLARSNYLSLVVEAPLERMRVVGFRFGGKDDQKADDASWSLWQRAKLDADQVLVHRTMLSLRRAYVIVGPHPRRPGEVLITPEHPSEVVVETYPEDRRETRAALKMYLDDLTGLPVAYLYLPNAVVKFNAPKGSEGLLDHLALSESNLDTWEIAPGWPKVNPTAPEVPVVEFANRPGLCGAARSEFEDVIDIQNRINATLLHRLVAEKFAVIRQRALLNLEMDEDEEGNLVAPVLPNDPSVAWMLDGENLTMWESSQTSTKDILSGVEADIRDLAAITRTPPHYLLNSIVNASGEALKSAETGLVSKVREHSAQTGESWEAVIRLAHLVAKTPGIEDLFDSEIIWADPESRTIAELYDAAVKGKGAGVPWRSLMELLGKSPQEIKRMESQRTQDALMLSLLAPPTLPAQPAKPAAAPAPGNAATGADPAPGTPAAA